MTTYSHAHNCNGDQLAFGAVTDGDWVKRSGNYLVSDSAHAPTRQIFTDSGTYTTPAGCKVIMIRAWGAGGGGGGAAADSGGSQAAAGGGGGAGTCALYLKASPAASYAYACGAAGAAGDAAAGTGGTGGDTTFGSPSICTGKGGLGGVGMDHGTAVLTALGGLSYQAGSVGDLGSSAQCGGYGLRLSGTVAVSGAGGASTCNQGGNSKNTDAAGNAGNLGGGGGGGGCALNTTDRAGGAGGAGLIIVDEYY